jgi:hypothetical protein
MAIGMDFGFAIIHNAIINAHVLYREFLSKTSSVNGFEECFTILLLHHPGKKNEQQPALL